MQWQPQLAINIGNIPFSVWNPANIWGQQPEYDEAILQAILGLNKEVLLNNLLNYIDFKEALAAYFSERAPENPYLQNFFETVVINSTQMSYQDALTSWGGNGGSGSGAGGGNGGVGVEEPGDPNANLPTNPPANFNPYQYYFTQFLDRERDLPILLEAESSYPLLDSFFLTKFSYFASSFFTEQLWALVGGQLMASLDTTILHSLLANYPEVCQNIHQNLDITFLNSLILKHASPHAMTQATGSSFFTQAMALATANTTSTALPELIAFIGSRLGQTRANQLLAKVGHLLTLEQQYTLKETYLYGSSRLGVKNQQLTLSTRVASVQNGSLTPIGNAILNTDSVFSGTAAVYGLPKAPTARIFNRTWGLKQYELSNHLGNAQVTISDKKHGIVGGNQVDFVAYEPEVKSATDYYAYGMEMPGKSYQSTAYRYGMNTQEKDNEIYGPGNTLGALYWEYDARIARRWNVDPVVKEYEGAYTTFSGNPIWFVDINGSDTSFATNEDRAYVMQFIDPKSELYSKEYVEKFMALVKSKTRYTFQSYKYDKDNGKKGGVTYKNPNDENNVIIEFTKGDQPFNEQPKLGLSPYASLWEETYHAFDFESGGLDFNNPTAYDEAEAWKFHAKAPGTSMIYSHFEKGKNYNDYTAMYRINNAETIQVANWLKFGMKLYYDRTNDKEFYGLERYDPELGGVYTGIYSNLSLK